MLAPHDENADATCTGERAPRAHSTWRGVRPELGTWWLMRMRPAARYAPPKI